MWISNRAKQKTEEKKMNKKEFDMGNEKITEYTSGGHNATIMPVEDNKNDHPKIPVIDAKKYLESQDTTMGFYSESELENSDVIYKFSDKSQAFVANLNMFRYRRKYLIRNIADLFNANNCFGMTMTFNTVIKREAEKIMGEYSINMGQYHILANMIFFKLANDYNHVDPDHYRDLMNYPDSLFYDWDFFMDKEEYFFYDIRKVDESYESYGYKVKKVKFTFSDGKHREIGVTMNVNINNDTYCASRVDFSFESASIVNITDHIDKINMIKGSL